MLELYVFKRPSFATLNGEVNLLPRVSTPLSKRCLPISTVTALLVPVSEELVIAFDNYLCFAKMTTIHNRFSLDRLQNEWLQCCDHLKIWANLGLFLICFCPFLIPL